MNINNFILVDYSGFVLIFGISTLVCRYSFQYKVVQPQIRVFDVATHKNKIYTHKYSTYVFN